MDKKYRLFWIQVHQLLLGFVDAIERLLDFPFRTAQARKHFKKYLINKDKK